MDAGEIIEFEQIAIEDESVQKELAKLELPEGAKIVCDPWIYGRLYLSMLKHEESADVSKAPMV